MTEATKYVLFITIPGVKVPVIGIDDFSAAFDAFNAYRDPTKTGHTPKPNKL